MVSEADFQKEQESTPTHLWVLRHGPTAWNVAGRIQGNVQNDILPERINAYLQTIGASVIPQPDGIIVSELQRTRQTAEALVRFNKWRDTPIISDQRLNEKKWGIFEGILNTVARTRVINERELRPQYPDIKTLKDVARIWDSPDFKVPGGESSREVRDRAKEALGEIAQKHPGQTLIVVSHAGVMISLGLAHHAINNCRVYMKDREPVIVLDED